jgi:hypothetical protein
MEDNFYFWKWKMTSILFENAVKYSTILSKNKARLGVEVGEKRIIQAQ